MAGRNQVASNAIFNTWQVCLMMNTYLCGMIRVMCLSSSLNTVCCCLEGAVTVHQEILSCLAKGMDSSGLMETTAWELNTLHELS